MLTVSDLTGLWTRSFKVLPDGSRDTTTRVAWLQALSVYADLRQPPGHAAQFAGVTCLRDLTFAHCRSLAAQQGFAGTFVARGEDVFEWLRVADFQPFRAGKDIGRLFWQGDILVEEGLQAEYLEHWNRDAGLPTAPCAAVTLRDALDGRWGALLRCGELFMYVRDRAGPITGATLAEAVEAAPSPTEAQDVVDFEISFGSVAPEGWLIACSTLPFRVSALLRHSPAGEHGLTIGDLAPDGTAFRRSWIATGSEGDTSVLFDGNAQDF